MHLLIVKRFSCFPFLVLSSIDINFFWQNEMFAKALEEQERRVRLEGKKNLRSQDGEWGGGEEEEYTEVARRQAFSKNVVRSM